MEWGNGWPYETPPPAWGEYPPMPDHGMGDACVGNSTDVSGVMDSLAKLCGGQATDQGKSHQPDRPHSDYSSWSPAECPDYNLTNLEHPSSRPQSCNPVWYRNTPVTESTTGIYHNYPSAEWKQTQDNGKEYPMSHQWMTESNGMSAAEDGLAFHYPNSPSVLMHTSHSNPRDLVRQRGRSYSTPAAMTGPDDDMSFIEYRCKLCNEIMPNRTAFVKHMRSTHSKCSQCGTNFPSVQQLKMHQLGCMPYQKANKKTSKRGRGKGSRTGPNSHSKYVPRQTPPKSNRGQQSPSNTPPSCKLGQPADDIMAPYKRKRGRPRKNPIVEVPVPAEKSPEVALSSDFEYGHRDPVVVLKKLDLQGEHSIILRNQASPGSKGGSLSGSEGKLIADGEKLTGYDLYDNAQNTSFGGLYNSEAGRDFGADDDGNDAAQNEKPSILRKTLTMGLYGGGEGKKDDSPTPYQNSCGKASAVGGLYGDDADSRNITLLESNGAQSDRNHQLAKLLSKQAREGLKVTKSNEEKHQGSENQTGRRDSSALWTSEGDGELANSEDAEKFSIKSDKDKYYEKGITLLPSGTELGRSSAPRETTVGPNSNKKEAVKSGKTAASKNTFAAVYELWAATHGVLRDSDEAGDILSDYSSENESEKG